MNHTTDQQRRTLAQQINDTSIQVKLLVPMLGMLVLLLSTTIGTNLYALGQFEAQVSASRLSQEQELVHQRIDAELTSLTERALAIALDDGLLRAAATHDRSNLLRLGVQLRARYQLDYLIIIGSDSQPLFGEQQLQDPLTGDLDLALATIERARVVKADQGALMTAAVPLKDANGVQGALLIGQAVDNAFLRQLNSNRTDPVLQIYTSDGRPLATSAGTGDDLAGASPADQGLLQRALGGERIEVDMSGADGGAQRLLYVPLDQGHQVQLVYSIALSSAEIQAYRARTLQQSVAILAIIGLATAGMLVFLIRRGIVSPLQRLDQVTEKLGAGNLDVDLGPGGRDEIGRLTSSFSTMALQLRDSFASLEVRNQMLEHEVEERKRVEEARAQMQSAVAQAEATILEMSTPIIPIDNHVLVMPLVGTIDSQRARQTMATLMRGIEVDRARTAIIDITGVPVIDTQVAKALLDIAQAVRLLGARAILTGIRPEVAQSIVGLGIDLDGITTYATLQDAISATRSQAVAR
ncbi:HAMP domain-containing protein [Oscillochloris sp. ZM17-4]|uniref:STAS domain-containing protein n=1 Tax=Oscillochloris sp. ZM17-4 TaxID=2866714 RepID=UPI001C736A77|nr:STAS domain-containing protein [Oscillochloris sp. ZM17-4]MBX0329459.1 HAMP domain-containing protein [Oscillochloris sp. ZM17-4]